MTKIPRNPFSWIAIVLCTLAVPPSTSSAGAIEYKLARTFEHPNPSSGARRFGHALAISGNRLAVATRGTADAVPRAGLFVFDVTDGTQGFFFDPTGDSYNSRGGEDFSLAVVQGNFLLGDPGAAIQGGGIGFVRLIDGFTGVSLLGIPGTIPTGGNGGGFGQTVAASDDDLLAGLPLVPGYQFQGEVRLYNGAYGLPGAGTLLRSFQKPTPKDEDYFGNAIAAEGTDVVVGTPWDDAGATDAGAVYIFNRDTGQLRKTLLNPDPTTQDYFGQAVAVSGDRLLVGLQGRPSNLATGEQAYLFRRSTGELLHHFTSPSVGEGGQFGSKVGFLGDTIVIGRPAKNGVGGDGTVYLFDGVTYELVATLPGGLSGSKEEFGNAIAASDRWLFVGATGAIGATSEGGDPIATGKVYMFTPCHDGTVDPSEECDDGNTLNTDACVASCVLPACGDGYVQDGVEDCDDGNTTDGDCCSSSCHFEGAGSSCAADSNVCTDDVCDGAGECTHPNNTAPCDDGKICTDGDHCAAGVCVSGGPLNCEDGSPCTFNFCSAADGCVAVQLIGPCSDGDACTTNDQCQGGLCVGGAPPNCADGNPCTDDSCVPASGCVNSPNAASCNDGNACTAPDVCSGGICGSGAAVNCQDGQFCNGVEGCSPNTGCTPGQAVDCSNLNADCLLGACNETTDACEPVATNEDGPCQHESACVAAAICDRGECEAAQATDCNDTNPCTDDGCDNLTGCTHSDNSDVCNDSDPCTTSDLCGAGQCLGSAVVACGLQDLCCPQGCTEQSDPDCLASCGNDVVESGEACDDGNTANFDDCLNTCVNAICGDGVVKFAGFGTYEMTFSVQDNVTLHALQFTVDYGAAPGEFIGVADAVSCTSLVAGAEVQFNNDLSASLLQIGFVTLDGFDAPGPILRCNFAATAPPAVSQFGLTVVDATDDSGVTRNPLPKLKVSRLIPVDGGEECDDSNTVDGDGCSATCGLQQRCGDANDDARITATDALRVLRRAVGQDVECSFSACDFDGNGTMTASDALAVLRVAVGLFVRPGCAYQTVARVSLTGSELIGALQVRIDYSGAAGRFLSDDGMPSCRNRTASVAAFGDDAVARLLSAAFVSLPGILAPTELFECDFESVGHVTAEDFAVDVTDATAPDSAPITPLPAVVLAVP